MGGNPGFGPYLRFAGVSLALSVVVAGIFAALAASSISSDQEDQAAQTAAALAGEAMASVFEGAEAPISDEVRFRADVASGLLIGPSVQGVRVSGSGGVPLYEAGTLPQSAAPVPEADGVGHDRVDGLFVTRDHHGAFVVEIAQDDAIVDDAVAGARSALFIRIITASIITWVVLQAAFRFGIGALATAHGRLTYLYDTGQQLRSSLDLHDVLTQLAGDATTLAHGEYGMVALFNSETSEIILRATYDAHAGQVDLHQRPIDEWFLRRSIATGATSTNNQAAAAYKQFFGADAQIARNAEMLCAPMTLRDRIAGALVVIRNEPAFDQTESHLVEELAAQAVTAVEQAQLFAKVRADATELESSYDATLKALMAALDAKDEVTEGHCERVARLTVQLAKQMEMPPAMLVHVERGALLHDVGKIGVPDAILKKPRQLSDHEWEAMRKHPLLAGLMVSKVGFLEPALPILLYHHERYDGHGYPFGLAAENIPLEARIFSIIDAYDAMTSDRPYRPAMSYREAMAEIRANAGKQFDPEVVAQFEHLMASRPELRDQGGRRVLTNHDEDLDPSFRGDADEPAA